MPHCVVIASLWTPCFGLAHFVSTGGAATYLFKTGFKVVGLRELIDARGVMLNNECT